MNPPVISVDGSEYELIPSRSQDSLAVCLDIRIDNCGTRVALLKFRCGVYEPEYEMIAGASVDALLEMAMRREDFIDNVRTALRWQAELQRIDAKWGVSPIFISWFPKNYEERA